MGKKRIEIVFIISMILSMLRTIVVVTNIKKSSYQNDVYYVTDSTLTTVFNVMFVIGLIAAVALAVLAGMKRVTKIDTKNDITSTTTWMLSFILVGTAIINVVDNLARGQKGGSFNGILVLLSVAMAVILLIKEFKPINDKTISLLTLIPVLFIIFRLLEDFMNSNAAPLANSGAFNISALAVLLLYFLCEGKAFINKGSAMLYYIFGYASMILLSVYSIPDVFLHCCGVFNFNYHSALSLVNILTVFYILSRLSSAELIEKSEESKK